MQQELPDHPQGIYQVSTLENADAVAFAFINNGDPVKYPYKYFDIEEDEVRIQITYTGLCQSDAMTVRQKWGPWYVMTQYVSALPACPGHEVVGYVTKAGPKVERLKLGDRVGCNPLRNSCGKCALCKKGDNQLCGDREFLYVPYFGGYSTHIQLKEKSVFKLPAGFKEDIGAPLLCAGVTVYAPIKRYLKRNGTAAVIGIGGLGHLAVQYASKLGMRVTAFTSTPEKKDFLYQLGAADASSSVDLVSLKAEQGKYDFVINTLHVNDKNIVQSYQRLTRLRGTYVQVGSPDAGENLSLDQQYIVLNQIRVAGSLIGSFDDTQDMLEFSHKHNIYPLVETHSFEEFPQAFAKLEHGRPRFRCVVNVIDWAKANGFEK